MKGGGFTDVSFINGPNLECSIAFTDGSSVSIPDMLTMINKYCSTNDVTAMKTWLDHIGKILNRSKDIASLIIEKNTSVLVNGTSGRRKAALLTAVSELILDPYYRTFEGFQVLIYKEFISMGFPFNTYFKSFETESSSRFGKSSEIMTFLDCCFQLIKKYANMFEFTSNLLVEIAIHIYSGRFGDFLFDYDKQRHVIKVKPDSIFDYLKDNWNLENSNDKSISNKDGYYQRKAQLRLKNDKYNSHEKECEMFLQSVFKTNFEDTGVCCVWNDYFQRFSDYDQDPSDRRRKLIK